MKKIFRSPVTYLFVLSAVLCLLSAKDVQADSLYPEGTQVTGSFSAVDGYDIATVRYVYTQNGETTYGFADISGSAEAGYTYSFTAPSGGITVDQGSNLAPSASATVVAEYYNLYVWDGDVDVSWYNETDPDFYLYTPAQLAGLAAIVNGSVDGTIHDYQVKGYRSSPADRSVNNGLPDAIVSTYYERTSLIAGVQGCAYKGVMEHDFANRTIHIMADMDMGGVDGSEIDMGAYDIAVDQPDSNWNRNLYDYPNWTPIGGEYLMDVTDSDSMIIAFFNGTIEGHGHNIDNIYCYRWSYRTVGSTAYGYSQGVGFVGDMGTLYNDDRGVEENLEVNPAIRDLGLSGFIYGRRMVGGFVGCIGGGSNAADGATADSGVCLENLANHAYVYCTDSKGLGGIVGCSMATGSIANCYNDGNIHAEYAAPSGGIIGSNEGMDLYCCYNLGTVYALQNRGRSIGCDNAGSGYTVDSCYYLENTGNDSVYPGYYTYNLAPSVSVNVTEMSAEQMQSAALLRELNVNGTAYVIGSNGYPMLYWELGSGGNGSLTIENPAGGTVIPALIGPMPNGTIVYLSHIAETGWNFRNYTLNGEAMTGDYVTVNGDCVVSAYFESSKAGVLKIAANSICNISVTKNGTVVTDEGAVTVEDYPVAEGDPIYEGDILIVNASIKDGMVPENLSYSYKASVGAENPFDYNYQYTGGEIMTTNAVTYTVGPEISGEDVSLTLDVVPLTTQKLWKYQGVTDWYDESLDVFVITTPEQLAGLEVLVNSGVTFAGKTILLGNDISLENNDGTGGDRFWDGIGLSTAKFAGTFDGQGYSVTGFHGCKNGLFAYCFGGSDTERAAIKNLTVYGDASGQDACGIVSNASYADIENCTAFCAITTSGGHSAGVVGYALAGCTVTDCSSYGNISGTGYIGGITGELQGTSSMSNCVNKGDITCLTDGGNEVGGIVGSLNGQISGCANYGNITATGRSVGGVAGQSVSAKASITDCLNAGNITMEGSSNQYDCVGGIIGYASYYKVSNTHNYGTINTDGCVLMNYAGSVFGREGAKSSSTTSNVYTLDTAYEYVENNTAFEDLPESTYCAGIVTATQEQFADSDGVLAAINGNGSFELTDNTYPDLIIASSAHVHSGGKASCTEKAVCESCGLEYGEIDPDYHKETVLRNVSEPAWTYSGYTGDQYCRACGEIVVKGEEIPADTSGAAITINIYSGDDLLDAKTYTVAEFDTLKTTSPALGYSYGGTAREMMAATEYVTIERIAHEFGYELTDIESLQVVCIGSTSSITQDTLINCSKYYDADGVEYDAPASISMVYTSLAGTLEEVAHEAQPSNSLRFGYGISPQQYEEGTSLGGRRLVSPVIELDFFVAATSSLYQLGDVNCDGYVNSADVTMLGRHVAKIETITDAYVLSLGDVDGSGSVTAADVTRLGQYVAKIISSL